MSTSTNYDFIVSCIYPTPQAFGVSGYKLDGTTSDGKARTLCPHVLGYNRRKVANETPGHERVLCYELVGTNGYWRTYKVKNLVGIGVSTTAWKMGPNYSEDTSIPNVKFYVPCP